MGEHTGKQLLSPTQKQGRDTHPERKSVASSLVRRAVSQILGRDTHTEESAGVLSEEPHSRGDVNHHIGQSFQVFVYFWPIILFLSSLLTCPWILPKMRVQLFPKMDCTVEAIGARPHLLQSRAPPFLTPKKPSCVCADREVFLDFRSGHLISLL